MNDFFKHIKDYQTGNSIFDTIIVAIISYTITFFVIILVRWVYTSAIMRDFDEQETELAGKYFVPNHITIFDHNNKNITPKAFLDTHDSIKTLKDHILQNSQQFYFLIAPTGVGKTTFLQNFYRYYRRKSWFSVMPTLLLGKIHLKDTVDEIALLLAKNGETTLDKLRFRLRHPRKTILLLDALDEFGAKNYTSQNEFWEALNEQWDIRRGELSGFGKVIIAVREQFLQYLNQSTQGLNSHKINGKAMQYLRLQPFDNQQIIQYTKKRFKGSPKKAQIDATINFFKKNELKESGVYLLGIPLILSFIEDLSVDSLKREASNQNKKVVDRYDVYSVIINKWLDRETGKNIGDDEIKLSFDFCEELAFKIAATTADMTLGITEAEFIALENNYFSAISKKIDKSFITHLGDRSLLVRHGIGRNTNIGFAHLSFLEYFLASYAHKIQTATVLDERTFNQLDSILENPSLNFASQMLLSFGWQATKTKYKTPRNDFEEYSFGGFTFKIPSAADLELWLQYIESISRYKAIQNRLKADLPSALYSADINWHLNFKGLNNLRIDNSNFVAGGYIRESSLKLIPYIKTFVNHFEVKHLILDAETLSYFDGISNLKTLYMEDCALAGNCLHYFSNCRHSLQELLLTINNLEDDDLVAFDGFSNINYLCLANNNVTGECLEYFRNSFSKIDKLCLESNNNEVNDIAWLEPLSDKRGWRVFGVSNIHVQYIYDNYLHHSISTITNLRLVNTGMNDDWFLNISEFKDLTRLDIDRNLLTGSNFHALNSSRLTLEKLGLNNNDLAYNSLEPLLDFPALKRLGIRNCPPQNPAILEALKLKGVEILQ